MYHFLLIAFGLAALLLWRNGHFWPGLLFALLAGWTYYSHETGTSFGDIKQELNRAVDDSAKKKYETGIRNEGFEYNTSKAH